LDICSSRYEIFTEPLKFKLAQKIQIYLSLVYIILDNTEICCFENRWQPEEAKAVAGAVEVLTHPLLWRNL
jgi:hypothetical protein